MANSFGGVCMVGRQQLRWMWCIFEEQRLCTACDLRRKRNIVSALDECVGCAVRCSMTGGDNERWRTIDTYKAQRPHQFTVVHSLSFAAPESSCLSESVIVAAAAATLVERLHFRNGYIETILHQPGCWGIISTIQSSSRHIHYTP